MIGRVVISHPNLHKENLKLIDFSITGNIVQNVSNFEIKQVFVNPHQETVSAEYVFSNDRQFCIYDMVFKVGDKVIKPELREKEEAKEIYKEAVEDHHTAILSQNLGNGLSSFSLGNISAEEQLELKFTASFFGTTNDNGVSVKFPLQTKYQSGSVTSELGYSSERFQFNVKCSHVHGIKDLKVSIPGDKKILDANTQEFCSNELPKVDAIFIDALVSH